ncbi:MAG: hypothetical protein HOV81_29975 [Kofleriaceae bacterium]|nr:hypothetical protein [Kofleriaceae bacterium]
MVTSQRSELGAKLRDRTATLGEVFAWLSALYFRGKLTYAQQFGVPLVMAPGLGLRPAADRIASADLRAMGKVEVESEQFVTPLRRDAELVTREYGALAQVVLLGSIATGKYVDTLIDVFGERLLFPESFVGRGDMSRGGLMLRAARSGEELAYRPVLGAIRKGTRPPKLPKPPRAPRTLDGDRE